MNDAYDPSASSTHLPPSLEPESEGLCKSTIFGVQVAHVASCATISRKIPFLLPYRSAASLPSLYGETPLIAALEIEILPLPRGRSREQTRQFDMHTYTKIARDGMCLRVSSLKLHEHLFSSSMLQLLEIKPTKMVIYCVYQAAINGFMIRPFLLINPEVDLTKPAVAYSVI
ncbi:hypothetical protein B0H19DRAFT_1083781 [Mycena capillaripes]|nr:hypothetical protein B0H19DRAFT_1083781 [Mycena capillaripes]